MAGVYDRFSALSERLIDRFDQGGVNALVETVIPNPDPLRPPTVYNAIRKIPAVARGVSADIVQSDPNLAITDIQVIIAAADMPNIDVGDIITLDGKDRRVMRVEPIPAVGVKSIYKMIVR